jgi:hypothetical protein
LIALDSQRLLAALQQTARTACHVSSLWRTADIVAFALPDVTLGRLRRKIRCRKLPRGFRSQKVDVGAGTP